MIRKRTGTKKGKVWNHRTDNQQGPTGTLAMLRVKWEGGNGQGQMWQKRACGTGLHGLRVKLGSRTRASRKISTGTVGGGWWEWEMYRGEVNMIPEERRGVGCNITVNISRTVMDKRAGGCRMWGEKV